MSICITASRLMKAKEVSENCRKVMENESLLIVLELQLKKQYLDKKALTA